MAVLPGGPQCHPGGTVAWLMSRHRRGGSNYLKSGVSNVDSSTFEYLKPTDKQLVAMAEARAAAKLYSDRLERLLPKSADKTFILRAHRTNAMWVNVCLTRNDDGSPRT